MPAQKPSASMLGLQVTGDIGGVTFVQRGQGRRTSYAKTYPSKTPSHLQAFRRTRFQVAVEAWRALNDTNKQTLNTITDKYKMCMSGYNLYLSCSLSNHLEWIEEYADDLGLTWTP